MKEYYKKIDKSFFDGKVTILFILILKANHNQPIPMVLDIIC